MKDQKKDLIKAENQLKNAVMYKVTSVVLAFCTVVFALSLIAITNLDKNINLSYIVLLYIPPIAMSVALITRSLKKFDPVQVKLYAEYLQKLDEYNNEMQEIRAEGEGWLTIYNNIFFVKKIKCPRVIFSWSIFYFI